MNNRLSNSSINKWLFCNQAWKLHYVDKYRTTQIGSALIFGTAIDKAMEYVLTGKDSDDTLNHATAEEHFDYHWRTQYINDVLYDLYEDTNNLIQWSKYDTDTELLTKEELKDKNHLAWLTMRKKGHLMIEAARKHFLPKVETVLSTQEKTELSNDEGDSSIGFCDAVVKLKNYDSPIILDFKTASFAYEEDSVRTSTQLSQYLHDLSPKYGNTRLAGYCVFLKQIKKNRKKICVKCEFDGSSTSHKTCNNVVNGKRCHGEFDEVLSPEASMQLIVDTIPLATEEFVIDNIENVNAAIKTGVIVKNITKCKDNGWGRPCEFYDLCWKNDDSNLIKKE